MGGPPSYQSHVVVRVRCVQYLPNFCAFQHSKHQTMPNFDVCRQGGHYTTHQKWREEVNSGWWVEGSSRHIKHVAANQKWYQEKEQRRRPITFHYAYGYQRMTTWRSLSTNDFVQETFWCEAQCLIRRSVTWHPSLVFWTSQLPRAGCTASRC